MIQPFALLVKANREVLANDSVSNQMDAHFSHIDGCKWSTSLGGTCYEVFFKDGHFEWLLAPQIPPSLLKIFWDDARDTFGDDFGARTID